MVLIITARVVIILFKNIGVDNAGRKSFNGEHLNIPKSKIGYLRNFKLCGKSVQNGTPTPENPVPIQNVPSSFDITSCGINLWDSKAMWDYVEAEVSSSNFERGVYDGRNGVRLRVPVGGLNFYYGFKPNTQYRFRYEHYDESDAPRHGVVFTIKYTDGTYGYMATAPYRQWGTNTYLTAADKSIEYFFMQYVNNEWTRFNLDSFQITEGADDISHTNYKGATKTIETKDNRGLGEDSLHELCSLPNGAKDALDGNKIIRRIKTLTVTNSSGVTHAPVTETTSRVIFWDWNNGWGSVSASANGLCNIALPHRNFDIAYRFSVTKGDSYTALSLVLPKTELATLDNSGVQAWVDAQIAAHGPIIFQYEYAVPQVYDLHPDEIAKLKQLKSVYPQTNIFTDADVQPILSLNAISYGE